MSTDPFDYTELKEALEDTITQGRTQKMGEKEEWSEKMMKTITEVALQAIREYHQPERSVKPEIQTYRGSRRPEALIAFLSKLENAFQIKGYVSDQQKITYFARHLEDSAQVWWNAFQGKALEWTYEHVIVLFKEAFLDANYEITLKKRLFASKQVGSVASYVSFFRETLLQLKNDYASNELYKDLFLFGLKPFVESQVRAQQPASLESAITIALEIGSVSGSTKGTGGHTSKRFRETSHGEPMEVDQLEIDEVDIQNAREKRYDKYKCYYCQQYGHVKKDCTKRLKDRGQSM